MRRGRVTDWCVQWWHCGELRWRMVEMGGYIYRAVTLDEAITRCANISGESPVRRGRLRLVEIGSYPEISGRF